MSERERMESAQRPSPPSGSPSLHAPIRYERLASSLIACCGDMVERHAKELRQQVGCSSNRRGREDPNVAECAEGRSTVLALSGIGPRTPSTSMVIGPATRIRMRRDQAFLAQPFP